MQRCISDKDELSMSLFPRINVGLWGNQARVQAFIKEITFDKPHSFEFNPDYTYMVTGTDENACIISLNIIQNGAGANREDFFFTQNLYKNPYVIALEPSFSPVKNERFLRIQYDYNPGMPKPDDLLRNISQGIDYQLNPKVKAKINLLLFSMYCEDSVFSEIPKDIIFYIAQIYLYSEFQKQPIPFLFFKSGKNLEQIPPSPAKTKRFRERDDQSAQNLRKKFPRF